MELRGGLFSLAQIVQSIIDNGGVETVEEILKQCENSTITDYLKEKYSNANFAWCGDPHFDLVNKYFADTGLTTVNDIRRKYMIEHNGLCFLVSYITSELYAKNI